MKKIEKRILMNYVFANSPSVSCPDHRCDTAFPGDDASEQPVCVQAVSAEAIAWACSEDVYEANDRHDLGGEG